MKTYREDGFRPPHKRPAKLKPSLKRWKLDKLISEVRTYLQSIRKDKDVWFAAEQLADKFKAKKHLIEQAIKKLRLEGLVGEEVNRALHDSNRDPICGFKGWSGWAATRYRLKAK